MTNGRFAWKNVSVDQPPRDGHGFVVLVQITCACGKGGQLALPAGRIGGEWVVGDFDHSFEIDFWMQLPEFPAPLVRQ